MHPGDALLAARMLALDPAGLGGVWLRGPAGELREAWLACLREAWPGDAAWRRVPLQVDDPRLMGGLDLAASLAAGRPVTEKGLLAEAAGGVLLLPMAERASPALAARLAAAMDGGTALVALDEARAPDDAPLAPVLAERLALVLLPTEPPTPGESLRWPSDSLAQARARLRTVVFDAAAVEALSTVAQALGVASLRAVWQAWRVACACAALAGRTQVEEADAAVAARLVLAPRATCRPSLPPQAEPPQPSPPNGASAPEPSREPSDPHAQADASPPPASTSATPPVPPALDDASPASSPDPTGAHTLLQATIASLPPGLLAHLARDVAGPSARRAATAAGRQGRTAQAHRGRRLPARRGTPQGQARLDLLATLRAAVPWQPLRRREREAAGLPPAAGLLLRRDDLHIQRHQHAQATTTIFVVDASGSQALQRMAEAKGAVELLLTDCYVRRDQVALIAFRGTTAELLLPPTRSLVRARRALAGLPGGGGTPLARGIAAATELGQRLQSRGEGRAQLVFLTDARANINRAGEPGRESAQQDATQAAKRLATTGLRSLLIDTAVRPQPQARTLADAMSARYLALPMVSAQAVSAAVKTLG